MTIARTVRQPGTFHALGLALATLLVARTAVGQSKDAAPTRKNFTVANHRAFVIADGSKRRKGPRPWVWYAPTLGSRYPGKYEQWMFSRFHDAGIAVAGVDVGESYGSPQGRAIYQKFYLEMTSKRGYAKQPVLLARSRGGLMLYNWAVEHPQAVAGIAGIYPVCDLTSYPGLQRAAGAYGMTADQLKSKLAEHNPVDRLSPLAKAKVPILHIHGDKDKVVPLESNSAKLASRYKALGGPVEVQVMKGQGHNLWKGWFQSQKLTDFVVAKALGRPVGTSTLNRKVMVGYQGWFNCKDDGAQLGWKHWARNRRKPFAPGNVTVDLWPDVSELDPDERYATGFPATGNAKAEVFSSANRKTVLRHFRWMRDYGIDGAFLQRFATALSNPSLLRNCNTVLSHVREGARRSGRAYAVMYDLSGLKAGQVKRIREDWNELRDKLKVTHDTAYLHHEGRPVVAVWGVGFSDRRQYSLRDCFDLVKWLKSTGCTVMLGVPSFWREGARDALGDPLVHQIIKMADVISPWTVGRYRTPEEASRHANRVWLPDRKWCERENLDYLPVVFPGFSWHNLKGGMLDQIPRLKGKFFWSQIVAAKRVGCKMIYVAMFDEVDEATAIFKCTNRPPTGNGIKFLTYEGLPSDHYLKLTGRAGKLLREETGQDRHRGLPQ